MFSAKMIRPLVDYSDNDEDVEEEEEYVNNSNIADEEIWGTGKRIEKLITGYHFVASSLKTAGSSNGIALAKNPENGNKIVGNGRGVAESSNLEVDSRQSWAPAEVVVGPLTPRVSFDQLYEIFSTFGEVVDIEVREGRERRRGVVMFKKEEEARKAVEAMDGGSIDLQQIVVTLSPCQQSRTDCKQNVGSFKKQMPGRN